MKLIIPSAGALLLALLLLLPGTPDRVAAEWPAIHFALAGSSPADSATVEPLSEVRLWFTEVPEEGTVAIRVVDESGTPVHADDVAQDPDDGRVFRLTLHHPLAPGRYTIPWRGMAADGHVVRGDLTFVVATP